MKLLLFSDLHGDALAAKELAARSLHVDVLVGAGDFGNARQRVGLCIDILKQVQKPALLVPGNNESLEELVSACASWPQAVVLHGEGADMMGRHFFGLGGGVPVTPFGAWSYDFTEEQATELLKPMPSGAILVSHSPPKGILDINSSGRSLGSEAVRRALEEKAPPLLVCGHIHSSGGRQQQVGNTLVVNAGPKGVVVEV